jgi:ABC-type glutathione transport system ATPase component
MTEDRQLNKKIVAATPASPPHKGDAGVAATKVVCYSPNRAIMSPLVVENAVKKFRQGDREVDALAGVSLEVQRGQFLAVMGASGSGPRKTSSCR